MVPFFGDQKCLFFLDSQFGTESRFWGDMIHRASAGPEPIPQRTLTAENLAEAIKFCLSDSAKSAAQSMGEQIRSESGEEKGVASFHRHLPLKNMRCGVDDTKAAVWWCNEYCVRLSSEVAGVLVEAKKLKYTALEPLSEF